MSPFSYIIGIVAFIPHPCVIQPQTITVNFAFACNIVITGIAMHVVYCHAYAAFAIIAFLFLVIAKFIHGVLAAVSIILANAVMTDTYPHAFIFFTVNIACFAKAFVQTIHINCVAVVSTAHVKNGFAGVIKFFTKAFNNFKVGYFIKSAGFSAISGSINCFIRFRHQHYIVFCICLRRSIIQTKEIINRSIARFFYVTFSAASRIISSIFAVVFITVRTNFVFYIKCRTCALTSYSKLCITFTNSSKTQAIKSITCFIAVNFTT